MKRYLSIGLCIALLTCLLGINVSASSTYESYEAGSILNGTAYMLRNCGSGKYLNVHNHVDNDGVNVYQWTYDGSIEQRFRFVFTKVSSSLGYYQIYPLCSSSGTNRRLNVVRSGGSLVNGCNLEINSQSTDGSQRFVIESAGPQTVYIQLYQQPNLVLGAWDNNNGSSSGKSSTSAGNVYLQTYTGSDYQKWELVPYFPRSMVQIGDFYIKSAYSNKYLTVSGTNVVQSAFTGERTQKWSIALADDGFYSLSPYSHTTYRLDISQGADGEGVNVGIYEGNNTDAQKFRILESGNGNYRIAPKCSSTRVLDVCGPSVADGANIQTWEYVDVNQQKWILEPVFGTYSPDYYANQEWSWVFANNNHLRISSAYRSTMLSKHTGMDLSDSTIGGVNILAPTSGTVVAKYPRHEEAGHYVVIRTNTPDFNGNKVYVGFMHMVEGSSLLSVGQTVTVGTTVGKVGTTGKSTGVHLHLSMWNGPNGNNSYDWACIDTAINPQRFYPNLTFTGATSDTRP